MIRFFNGRVLRFAPEMRVTEDEVWIDGGRIVYVGAARADAPHFDRTIDLRGDLLLPGFKNAHTHTAMTFLRSKADDMPLKNWLSEQVWPNEAKLTDGAVYTFTKLGIIDAGFQAVLCSGFNDFDKDITQVERDYIKYNSLHELISMTMGIHGEYTTCRERMAYMASLVKKYRSPCFAHLSETKSEVDGCIERYGTTPPQVLDSLGLFDYGGGGYHCCYMSEEDIALFARKQLWAVTNPASNLKLASGIAPIVKLQRAGVPLAIGTDGAASNNALDMFREMYLVSALQKVAEKDASVCAADSVLEMACVGGARAMGLADCDDIAEGKRADLIVIDLQRPNMQPLHNLTKNLVYAGSKENVRLTMVNGKVLYENGAFFVGDEPAKIYAEANAFVRTL